MAKKIVENSTDLFRIQALDLNFQEVMNRCEASKDYYENVCNADFWRDWWRNHPMSRITRSSLMEKMLQNTENDNYNISLWKGTLQAGINISPDLINYATMNSHNKALIDLLNEGAELTKQQLIGLGNEGRLMVFPWIPLNNRGIQQSDLIKEFMILTKNNTQNLLVFIIKLINKRPDIKGNKWFIENITDIFSKRIKNKNFEKYREQNTLEMIDYMINYTNNFAKKDETFAKLLKNTIIEAKDKKYISEETYKKYK